MKKIFIFFLCVFSGLYAQNKPILYGFDNIPQTLLLNPGSETTYKYHVAVPFLSGNHVHFGTKNFTIADIFRKNGVGIFSGEDISDRIVSTTRRLNEKDYFSSNVQLEVLGGGYRLNTRDYLSAGYYTELDVFSSIPKDVLTLILEGNADYIEKPFSISQINIKAESVSVLHAGIARQINNRLTIGGRFKIYSGGVSFVSVDNSGTYLTTTDSEDGIYKNTLTGVNLELHASGVFNSDKEFAISPKKALLASPFSSNLGFGLDFGFTFNMTDQLQFSGSILDIGYIAYTKDNRNISMRGNYSFEGIPFNDINNNYWSELENSFNEELVRGEDAEAFTVIRPIKMNGTVRYSFGKSRNLRTCHHINFKDYYDNGVGGHAFIIMRPTGPKFAITGFYERKFAKFLNTKVTYTVDDFSYTNIGFGISSNFWKLNMYATASNIIGFTDIANSNTAAFQFGINFIIN